MIKNNAKAEIGKLILEVNFDDENRDCIKVTLGSETEIIKYTDLFAFMFTLATKEQQAKMIPVREELGYQYMKQVRVRLKQDLKEGEEMVVNVPINVPKIIEDQILYDLEQRELEKEV